LVCLRNPNARTSTRLNRVLCSPNDSKFRLHAGSWELGIDMNWDAVGAIAELVGAIAVLITLLYLARQIAQNRKSVESASSETVLSNISNALQNAPSSSQVTQVLLRRMAKIDRTRTRTVPFLVL